eukprot:3026021-Pleurochrysis_carterae.AAC.8
MSMQTDLSAIHQSMYSVAFVPLHNPSDEPVLLLHSTHFSSVTLRPDLGVRQGDFTVISPADSYWEGVDGAYALAVEKPGEPRSDGEERVRPCQEWEGGAEKKTDAAEEKSDVSLLSADANEGRALFEGLGSFALPMTVERHRSYHDLPFKEGGPAKSLEDLETLGLLDLTQSYDTEHSDQPRLFMKDGTLQPVVDVCLKCSSVWTRNAKAPSAEVHPLTQIRIATGNNPTIRQKAYPIRISMQKPCELT